MQGQPRIRAERYSFRDFPSEIFLIAVRVISEIFFLSNGLASPFRPTTTPIAAPGRVLKDPGPPGNASGAEPDFSGPPQCEVAALDSEVSLRVQWETTDFITIQAAHDTTVEYEIIKKSPVTSQMKCRAEYKEHLVRLLD
jgi:hypothetical protein